MSVTHHFKTAKKGSLFLLIHLFLLLPLYGQEGSLTSLQEIIERQDSEEPPIIDKEDYQLKWYHPILPVSLSIVGSLGLGSHLIETKSHQFTNYLLDLRGEKSRLTFDDYLQYLPLISHLTLGNLGLRSRHTTKERFFISLTSSATMALVTTSLKYCIDEKRPQFDGWNSFPSGHTATAFVGAELVRIEYGGWYGVAAYAVASSVGFLRMYNGRHWLHDVIAGAGLGILSAQIGAWCGTLWQKNSRNDHPVSHRMD